MLAVLTIAVLPVAVAVSVKVALPPTGRSTIAEMLPLPLTGQAAPPAAVQVQVAELSCAGRTSVTVAPTTGLGPELLATIV